MKLAFAGSLWLAAIASFGCAQLRPSAPPRPAQLELFEWERGIALRSRAAVEPLSMYLWFYEWRLFGALEEGELTPARHDWPRSIAPNREHASIEADMLRLEARVVGDVVELELWVDNRTARAFSEHAAIIACFNPGPPDTQPFEMGHHKSTFFLGADGVERLADRDLHFRAALRPSLESLSRTLEFAFSRRWASSERDDHGGLLVRTSQSGRWSCGVAWEDWLGVQAHNPWLCMHIATRVGPLAPGASRRIRGRLVLLEGGREAVLERLRAPWDAD